MLNTIKRVDYVEGFKLKLYFSNGTIKVVDLEDWVKEGKGYFAPLRKMNYFKKVTIDESGYTICWPNGLDLCPDVLYEMGREIKVTPHLTQKVNHKIGKMLS